MSLKFDEQPKKLSDIPVYSEINPKRESSPPHVEMFENQAYSTNTLENTYTTIEQENPYDHVLGTKTAPHKEKSKKDQCEKNLVWIVISVNILLLLAVGAVAVGAFVQVSETNSEIVSLRASLHLTLDEIVSLNTSFRLALDDSNVSLRASLSNSTSSLNDEIVSLGASLSNSSAALSQSYSSLENKTQIRFDGLESRVNDLNLIRGTLYTRWGKSTCPQVGGTELIYSGIAGGSWYNQRGGGANYLCMPKVPEYSPTLRYRGGTQGHAHVCGSEYERSLQGVHNHNVSCAVCRVSTRSTVLMIPAKATCPSSWTREYYGYIMTTWKGDHSNSGMNELTRIE